MNTALIFAVVGLGLGSITALFNVIALSRRVHTPEGAVTANGITLLNRIEALERKERARAKA